MIPLRDNIPPRSFPGMNYLVIGVTTLVFVAQLAGQREGRDPLVETFGMMPARVAHPHERITVRQPVLVRSRSGEEVRVVERVYEPSGFPAWLTPLTCIFLHGGWLHFLGNMWFLHIFGDNVEDRFGHFGFLLFYLGAGVAASLAHLATNAGDATPTIGASGAIAGVMGAYLLLYPRAKVVTLVPLVVFIQTFIVPAPLFLGFWFLLQVLQARHASVSGQAGGVAWWAHIGGFIAGLLVALLLDRLRILRPRVEEVLPNTDRFRTYRYQHPRWKGDL